MRLDHHLEQLDGAMQQLQFGIPQLLELLLLQLTQTHLEQLLLIEPVGQLHEHKYIIVLGLGDHVLAQDLDQ